MKNTMKMLSATISRVLLLVLFSFSFIASAESSLTMDETQAASQQKTGFLRNKDYACTQCHKDNHEVLLGVHGRTVNEKTGRHIGCIDCHQDVGSNHRDGASDVVKFTSSQIAATQTQPASSPDVIAKQNQACLECHQGDALREPNWTHDVHTTRLTCSSCHSIHPTLDPMKDIEEKSRIQMCVDCHSEMTIHKKQEVK